MHGSFYVVDYTFVAALPDIFERIYSYNELYVGLCYLPRGVGIIVGSYFTGKMMDRNYQSTLREHRQNNGLGDETCANDSRDDPAFPIERARSRGTYYVLAISTGTVVGYGWAVSHGAHPAVPLILQFFQGFWGTYYYTTYGALMVDSFPEKASTASAATSVARCAMAAAGVAVLEPLLQAVGRGWYFTILGLWSGMLGVTAVFLLRKKGLAWRCARLEGQSWARQ
jgi:MFS family permease